MSVSAPHSFIHSASARASAASICSKTKRAPELSADIISSQQLRAARIPSERSIRLIQSITVTMGGARGAFNLWAGAGWRRTTCLVALAVLALAMAAATVEAARPMPGSAARNLLHVQEQSAAAADTQESDIGLAQWGMKVAAIVKRDVESSSSSTTTPWASGPPGPLLPLPAADHRHRGPGDAAAAVRAELHPVPSGPNPLHN